MHLHTRETKRALTELILGLLHKPESYAPKQHCKWYLGLGIQESFSEFSLHVSFMSLLRPGIIDINCWGN